MFAAWNITQLLTPAQSPQSNALCERIGGILRTVVEKLQSDSPQHSLSQHLAAACFAHNSTVSSHGYSPHMLVTGTKLNFPGILHDNLAAMSARLTTPNQRIQLLHKARVLYTQSLHCASLTKAIMTQVAKKPTAVVEHGNHVFFWNQNSFGGCWKGPGVVVGTNPDAHSVLVRYGNQTYDRHISAIKQLHHITNTPTRVSAHTSPVSNNTTVNNNIIKPQAESLRGNDTPELPPSNNLEHTSPLPFPETPVVESNTQIPTQREPPPDIEVILKSPQPNEPTRTTNRINAGQPPQRFQPEAFYNSAHPLHIFTVYHTLPSKKSDNTPTDFAHSRQKELSSILEHEVVKAIPITQVPRNHTIIQTRWIDKHKVLTHPNERIGHPQLLLAKSRLVAKGFQEHLNDEAVDSPTATKEGIRLVTIIAAQNLWNIGSIDIATAFLQANKRSSTEPKLYIQPPPEAGLTSDTVWLLLKSLYGLRSAPKSWWLSLTNFLKNDLGFEQCSHDVALFTLRKEGTLHGIIAIHVDDMLVTGDSVFKQSLKRLSERFKFGSEQWDNFLHLGIRYQRNSEGVIEMSQTAYIEKIDALEVNNNVEEDNNPLSASDEHELRATIGALMWVACSTRPDISVDVSMSAAKLSNPTKGDLRKINKTIRYLKGTAHKTITYKKMGNSNLRMIAFGDSAFQNLTNAGTQGGIIVGLSPDDGIDSGTVPFAMVGYKSNKIRRVVTSTFSGELINQTATFDLGAHVRDMYDELKNGKQTKRSPLDLMTDCQSVVDHVRSMRMHTKERRLFGDVFCLREAILLQEMRSINHIDTEHMLADGLTKGDAKLKDALLRAMAGTVTFAINSTHKQQ